MKLSDLGEAYKDIRKLLSELQSGRAVGLYCPSLIAERQRQFLQFFAIRTIRASIRSSFVVYLVYPSIR